MCLQLTSDYIKHSLLFPNLFPEPSGAPPTPIKDQLLKDQSYE